MKRKMKTSTIILIVVCFVGLSLLLYPSFANFWNRTFATAAISDYTEAVRSITKKDYQAIWQRARDYNAALYTGGRNSSYSTDMQTEYSECLNVANNSVMGYIEIPKINVYLPIYHGTSDGVLQIAAGHIDWSSLPVGGENTHCLLSAHRGLASAKLFTDLDLLRSGDIFTLNILDETLTYEVDQIRTVEPEDLSELTIEEGMDYCTLVTCTPYGINTHRLLVRGRRIENISSEIHVVSEAVIIDQLIVAFYLAIPILFALLLAVMFKKPEKKPTIQEILSDNGGESK